MKNKGYLFISNSTKPTLKMEESLEPIAINSFGLAAFHAAKTLGFKLYCGVNLIYPEKVKCTNYDITFYNQHIYRNIFAFRDNYKGYKNCCDFLKTHPDIEVIHCNTPIGGVIGRLCGRKFHKKVIYTAHGFHFYKGAPLMNRTVFKCIEWWMARYTDALITINKEDYEAAKRFKLKPGGKVFYVPGVGVDIQNIIQYDETYRNMKRECLGIRPDDFVCIIVGDLNDNKNVGTLIDALAKCSPQVHYLVCGLGPNEGKLKERAEQLGVADRCHFLGYRTDIKQLYLASDVFLFASKREGLPRSTMEAMCAGLPCVVSKIRGNVDLIDDREGGILINPMDVDGFADAINELARLPVLREKYGEYNKEKIKNFDINIVKAQMVDIYKEVLVSHK